VADALGAVTVREMALPGYTSHLKDTMDALSGAVERMLFAEMPRYIYGQTLASGATIDPDALPLQLDGFVAEFRGWANWWNTHQLKDDALEGQTLVAPWLTDPILTGDVDAAVLWMFHPRGRPY
jgi:hypothetical protein